MSKPTSDNVFNNEESEHVLNMSSSTKSDWIDELYQQNGYNLTQEVGSDESVVWFTLEDFLKAKQAIRQHIEREKREARIDELERIMGLPGNEFVGNGENQIHWRTRIRLAELRKDTDNE